MKGEFKRVLFSCLFLTLKLTEDYKQLDRHLFTFSSSVWRSHNKGSLYGSDLTGKGNQSSLPNTFPKTNVGSQIRENEKYKGWLFLPPRIVHKAFWRSNECCIGTIPFCLGDFGPVVAWSTENPTLLKTWATPTELRKSVALNGDVLLRELPFLFKSQHNSHPLQLRIASNSESDTADCENRSFLFNLVRGDHPNSWKNAPRMHGQMKIFHVGSHKFRESLRELLRELWVSYCSSRGMPFRERNFVFREWNFEFRELLWEYPGTLRELREWPFHSESVFPEIGVVPRLLI